MPLSSTDMTEQSDTLIIQPPVYSPLEIIMKADFKVGVFLDFMRKGNSKVMATNQI